MTRPLALLLLVALVPLTAEAADCPDSADITTREAPACVGMVRRVVGRVDNVGKGKSGVTFINFCKNFRNCPFVAVVFPKRLSAFPDLSKLPGETIEVSGQIASYNDQSQIVLEDASQLVVRGATLARPPREPERAVERRPSPEERAPEPRRPAEEERPIARETPERRPPPVDEPTVRDVPARRSNVWPDEGPKVNVETVDPAMPDDVPVRRPPEPKRVDPPKPPKPAVAAAEPMRAVAPSVGAQDAAKYVGKRAKVKGRVTQVTFEGEDLVARMSGGKAGVVFAAVVPGDKVERFAAAVESWDGATVEVEGDVVLYAGVPAIYVRTEQQVSK